MARDISVEIIDEMANVNGNLAKNKLMPEDIKHLNKKVRKLRRIVRRIKVSDTNVDQLAIYCNIFIKLFNNTRNWKNIPLLKETRKVIDELLEVSVDTTTGDKWTKYIPLKESETDPKKMTASLKFLRGYLAELLNEISRELLKAMLVKKELQKNNTAPVFAVH